MRCYCCSDISYSHCCEPFLTRQRLPEEPEQLMRSRFSAYCTANYQYILDTYCAVARASLTKASLAEHAEESTWFALQIIPQEHTNVVEFKAFYFHMGSPQVLHETSDFEIESGRWVYTQGKIHSDSGNVTIGRNDPCPCLSGKKFKQCCLKKRA